MYRAVDRGPQKDKNDVNVELCYIIKEISWKTFKQRQRRNINMQLLSAGKQRPNNDKQRSVRHLHKEQKKCSSTVKEEYKEKKKDCVVAGSAPNDFNRGLKSRRHGHPAKIK